MYPDQIPHEFIPPASPDDHSVSADSTPEIPLGQDGDDAPEPAETIDTACIAPDDDRGSEKPEPQPTSTRTSIGIGRVAVPANAEDPRRRPVTANVPQEPAESPALPESSPSTEAGEPGADTPAMPSEANDRSAEIPEVANGTLESFEPYRAQMNRIDAQLAAGLDPIQHPEEIDGYIGPGRMSHAIETPDGRVLKLPRMTNSDIAVPPPPDTARTHYINPLMAAKGGECLEQIVTATEDNGGGIVVEKAPGASMESLSDEQRQNIPLEHFEALMRACHELAARGLQADPAPDDIFHSQEHGFTIIDIGAPNLFETPIHEAAGHARAFGSEYALFRPIDFTSRSASVANFLTAYTQAFGEDAVPPLLQQWQQQGLLNNE